VKERKNFFFLLFQIFSRLIFCLVKKKPNQTKKKKSKKKKKKIKQKKKKW